MAASSDLQALQLENRNLQQKLDWKQLKINELETKVRDLRGGGLAADLGRIERSIGRLSLQMEHVQLVIKKPEWSFHTFAMPEKTASSAHTIFVRPPSGDRIEVTIPPGKQPGEVFTVMLEDKDAYPPDWPWHAAPPAAPAHSYFPLFPSTSSGRSSILHPLFPKPILAPRGLVGVERSPYCTSRPVDRDGLGSHLPATCSPLAGRHPISHSQRQL